MIAFWAVLLKGSLNQGVFGGIQKSGMASFMGVPAIKMIVF